MTQSTTINSEFYQIITGYITDLEIFDTAKYFLSSRQSLGLPDINLPKFSGIIKKDHIVQYFRCKLGDKIIEGVFGLILFKQGDYVEIVVEPMQGGSYFAYALRRPDDNHLWVQPNATTGTEYYKDFFGKPPLLISLLFSVCGVSGIVLFIYSLIKIVGEPLSFYFVVYIFLLILSFFLMLVGYIYIKIRKKPILEGSPIADKIFATLGHPNPKKASIESETDYFRDNFYRLFVRFSKEYVGNKTDEEEILQKFSRIYQNEHSDNDLIEDILLKQFLKEQSQGAYWLALYPKKYDIPKEVIVIHTEKNDENINEST